MEIKKSYAAAAVAAIIVLAACGWWLRASKEGAAAAASATQGAATLVTVTIAQKQDVPVDVTVNGSVVSLNSVDIKPQVSNVVEKVHVKEGDTVRAGQALFSLDARADIANLQKAKAQQMKDQAQLSDFERQYKRSQDLLAQNFIAKSATETVLAQLESQRAAVEADRAAVQAAQVQLSYDEIRAPIAGRTGAIPVFAGTLVQPAMTLVTITQMDPIAVNFPVPEGRLSDLLEAAKQKSPVLATVPGRTEPLKGFLSFVDNTVDPNVGTVRAKAQFVNKDNVLWPGQYVNTSVTVRTLKDATVVPLAAIITSPTGRIAYVVKDDVAQPRKVELQYATGDRAVVQGLQPGERIVLEGKQNLRPGSHVRVERAAGQGNMPGGGAASVAKKDPS
jgi:membrane fusion protein, multidrug efflux system